MNAKLKKALTSWKAISSRLLSGRFLHQSGHMSVIVCYAPTETSDDAAKDQFYDDLSVAVNHTSRHDVTIVMGDLNASIGSDRIAHRGIIGPVCSGFANDDGSRLLDFCASNELRIGSSWFPRKCIHQLTWYCNDGVTRKVLDHVIISRCWFSCMTSEAQNLDLPITAYSPSPFVCAPRLANRPLQPSAITQTPLTTKPSHRNML